MSMLETNLFATLESRNRIANPLAEPFRIRAFFFVEFVGDGSQLRNVARHAPPGVVLQFRVALPVQSEMCVIQSFDQPVSALRAVRAPRLHGKRLVQIIFVSRLLVRFFDLRLNDVG